MSAQPKRSRPWRRARRLWRFYAPHVRSTRRILMLGSLAAVGVVCARAALPVPFHGIVDSLEASHGAPAAPPTTRAFLLAGLAFLGLFALLGAFDLLARVWFARFCVSMVGQVREDALGELASRRGSRLPRADLITRLVGDTARLKDGLKGFLVHVATNGLFFLAVVGSVAHFGLGLVLVMVAGLLLILAVTCFAAFLVYRRSQVLRERESKLAGRILEAIRTGSPEAVVSSTSGSFEASLTRIQGRAAVVVYLVLGILLVLCFEQIGSGPGAERELLAFSSYGLLLLHPVVRLARQGTRIGKVLAYAARIERAGRRKKRKANPVAPRPGEEGPEPGSGSPREGRRAKSRPDLVQLGPLREGLAMKRVVRRGTRGRRARVGPLDLVLRPGEKVAVLGHPGCGKSTLLRTLATGRREEGQVLWDDVDLSRVPGRERKHRMVHLRGWHEYEDLLAGEGARASLEVPEPPEVYLVDDVRAGEAAGLLVAIQARRSGALVVAALEDPRDARFFDRVVVLRAGRRVGEADPGGLPSGHQPGLPEPGQLD